MKQRIFWITRTAVLLALLVSLQAVTKPLGQLVTGSCVNAVLAVAALIGGLSSGLTVAACSPILAFWLGIAPQLVTVPVIMLGNCVYVVLLVLLAGPRGKVLWVRAAGWIAAAICKSAVLYGVVVQLICKVLASRLLQMGLLKEPMLKLLPVTFGWPQLVTALLGGAVAMLILPVLRKVVRR